MFVQRVSKGHIRLVTSASDLSAASTCEFAFLRRVDAKFGREVEVPEEHNPMLARAAELGDAHEARVLARYRTRFGAWHRGQAGGVAEILQASSVNEAEVLAAQTETLTALHDRADIIFQATFFQPNMYSKTLRQCTQTPLTTAAAQAHDPEDSHLEIGFIGYADFLYRTSADRYEVQDTKLARKAKVTALMQLAAYAEQLERLNVPVSEEAVLLLGDGAVSRHRLADIAPIFRARRNRLHQLLRERAAAHTPVAWASEDLHACGRCVVCEPEILRVRDPLLIAGIRTAHRDRLVAAGLKTIDAVAAALPRVSDHTLNVTGMPQPILQRLALQANVQLEAKADQPPPYHLLDGLPLAAIPPPDPGDLFFDFEGDPLYREPGDDPNARWGIDYLFGLLDAQQRFTPIWAHDLPAERAALERFIDLVTVRRRTFPKLHIYHYAAYERTHLLAIAARHGVCEAEVDQLLREHVLVDLYPIVRRALRVGATSYSIKKLEPLYMGEQLRDQEGVTSGAQSVGEYAEASALLRGDTAAQRAEGQRRLDAIAEYNRYDCLSTLRLRDWLLRLAREHAIAPAAQPIPDDGETEASKQASAHPDTFTLSPVAAALAQCVHGASQPQDRTAIALAGSAIDYYQREQKSFWWAHFSRLSDPVEDWADTRDVMIVDAAASECETDWQAPQGRARLHRRTLRLRGQAALGSSLKPGNDAYLLYRYPPPFAVPGAAPGARLAKIIECSEDSITVQETRGEQLPAWQTLPTAVTPGPPPRAAAQNTAIEHWGNALAGALRSGRAFADPVFELMRRQPPKLRDGGALTAPTSAEALAVGGSEQARTIGAVIASLSRMGSSTLAVQGPPGTGKTYLAARVIRVLVEQYDWQIGVVAQSHRVVEHVLEGVVAAGLDLEQVGKVAQRGRVDSREPGYTVLRAGGHETFLRGHRAAGRGSVIGGTAWDFANPSRVPRAALDLLVIDEAGQFALAPTIAVAVAAERLLLLGDPQQLPQVSQGTHPEPVDTSALGWLLGEHATIPEQLGYFLAESRRMRPELAAVVSELAYEGRLRAHPSATLRELSEAGAAGLTWHPVRHYGNSTSSIEEAAQVVQIVRTALRHGKLTEPGSAARPLTQFDVIVVAAYNAQVACITEALAAAGISRVRVGTVDRFQGQEAPLAVVSLAASHSEDVPRGLEFLLMRHRLNVAISRAQWGTHLVSSDRLGEGLPRTAEAAVALSGYLRLLEHGSAQTAATTLLAQ